MKLSTKNNDKICNPNMLTKVVHRFSIKVGNKSCQQKLLIKDAVNKSCS